MSSLYDSGLYDSATYDGVGVGDPVVELFLNGSWVNITTYVRVADGIQIRRGRQDWSSAPTFATCDMTLDNRDGRFTPRNTTGAYYPYLVRNTPLRVSVYKDDGTTTVRFWGDVAEFPVNIVGMGFDLVTHIQGCGLRRRLSRTGVLQSTYRVAAGGLGSLVAYWPLEVNGAGATQYASTTGAKPVLPTNTVNGGTSSDFSVTSADLPALVGDKASLQGFVPSYTLAVAGQQVRMLLECDTSTAGQGVDVVVAFTSGAYVVAEYVPVANTLQLVWRNADGTTVVDSGLTGISGSQPWTNPSRISVESVQNGTGVDFQVKWYNVTTSAVTGGFSVGLTAASTTLTPVKSVTVRNGGSDVTTVVGHITVQNTKTTQFDLLGVTQGYAGETARDRAVRLAAANGVALDANSEQSGITSELMGVQGTDTFLNLLDETAFVDDGISTETVDARSLTWWPRSAMYSKVPKLVLSLNKMDDFQFTDDDQTTVNDVTANRVNGGSANYMVTAGNLAIATIGDYPASYDLNVYTDDQLPYQAQWRAAVGTVDEPRRPNVGFDAMRLSSSERNTLVSCREGDRFTITLVSASLAPTVGTQVEAQILGWTETITDTTWRFDINTRPGLPYEGGAGTGNGAVLILDDSSYGILDTNRLAL